MQPQHPRLDTSVNDAPTLSSTALLSDADVESLGDLNESFYPRIEQAISRQDKNKAREQVRQAIESQLTAERHPWADVWAHAVAHDHILHDAKYRVMLDWFNSWVARIDETKTLDRFTDVKRLGEGGMGVVFEAYDPKRDDRVAIKVPYVPVNQMPEDRITVKSSALRHLNFLEEAHKHLRIPVQGCVPLFDLGMPGVFDVDHVLDHLRRNPIWFSMKVYTRNLQDYCKSKGGKLPVDEAVEIMGEVARILQRLHRSDPGIIHRDVKPANILLTHDKRPVVSDFGLSIRRFDQRATGNHTSGTCAYMSPEHFDGSATLAKSDIWSWAVILYELICGKLPFAGQDVENWIRSGTCDSLDTLEPDCDRSLATIVERCFRRRPGEEFRSFKEVLDALESRRRNRGGWMTRRNLLTGIGFATVTGLNVVLSKAFSTTSNRSAHTSGLTEFSEAEKTALDRGDVREADILAARIGRHLASLRRVWLKSRNEIDEGFRRMADAGRDLRRISGLTDHLSVEQLIAVGSLAAEYRGCVWSFNRDGFHKMQNGTGWLQTFAEDCASKLAKKGEMGQAAASCIRGIQGYNSSANEAWSRPGDRSLAIKNLSASRYAFLTAASCFETAAALHVQYRGTLIDEFEQLMYVSQMCIAGGREHLLECDRHLERAQTIAEQEKQNDLVWAHYYRVRGEQAALEYGTKKRTRAVDYFHMAREMYDCHFRGTNESLHDESNYLTAACDLRLSQLGVRIDFDHVVDVLLSSPIRETDIVDLKEFRKVHFETLGKRSPS